MHLASIPQRFVSIGYDLNPGLLYNILHLTLTTTVLINLWKEVSTSSQRLHLFNQKKKVKTGIL